MLIKIQLIDLIEKIIVCVIHLFNLFNQLKCSFEFSQCFQSLMCDNIIRTIFIFFNNKFDFDCASKSFYDRFVNII